MSLHILTDKSLMPFGKHKGKPMEEIPASYFHYLWHNGMKYDTETSNVAQYIKENMEALKEENTDLIWE